MSIVSIKNLICLLYSLNRTHYKSVKLYPFYITTNHYQVLFLVLKLDKVSCKLG